MGGAKAIESQESSINFLACWKNKNPQQREGVRQILSRCWHFAQLEIPFHASVTAGNKKLDLFCLLRSSLERSIDFRPEKVGTG